MESGPSFDLLWLFGQDDALLGNSCVEFLDGCDLRLLRSDVTAPPANRTQNLREIQLRVGAAFFMRCQDALAGDHECGGAQRNAASF